MMKICPRCRRLCLHKEDVMNSISHIDNKTLICPECGLQSGLCGQGAQDDIVEMYIENRFKEELGK